MAYNLVQKFTHKLTAGFTHTQVLQDSVSKRYFYQITRGGNFTGEIFTNVSIGLLAGAEPGFGRGMVSFNEKLFTCAEKI